MVKAALVNVTPMGLRCLWGLRLGRPQGGCCLGWDGPRRSRACIFQGAIPPSGASRTLGSYEPTMQQLLALAEASLPARQGVDMWEGSLLGGLGPTSSAGGAVSQP